MSQKAAPKVKTKTKPRLNSLLVKQELPAEVQIQERLQSNPSEMLATAINKGLDITAISRLMDLNDRWMLEQSKKQFTIAFAEFQRFCPVVSKGNVNAYVTKGGDHVSYKSSDLSDIDLATKEHLSNNGLTKDWEIEQTVEEIKVTCVVTHVGGFSKRVPLTAKRDNSGGKNDIQALGSTITYLQRYSLMAALGMTARGMDDDGKGHTHKSSVEEAIADGRPALKDEQVMTLARAIHKKEKTLEDFEKNVFVSTKQKESIDKIVQKLANESAKA